MAGAAYVFWCSAGVWQASGLRITPSDYKPYQLFGASVCAAGTNLLVVGAPRDTAGRGPIGATYVFRVKGFSQLCPGS